MIIVFMAETGHLVSQGKSQGKSIFVEVWAISVRKLLTDECLQQDMDTKSCLTEQQSFASLVL